MDMEQKVNGKLEFYETYLNTLSNDELNAYHTFAMKTQTNVDPYIFEKMSRYDKLKTLIFHYFVNDVKAPGFDLWYEVENYTKKGGSNICQGICQNGNKCTYKIAQNRIKYCNVHGK
jgi:hypothetical protein